MIDINRLTLGEVAKIEELSGQPISAIGNDDAPKGLALAALAFVAKRREDANFSWNAAQNLTFDEAQGILGFGEQEAEQIPLDDAPKTRSKSTTPKS
ncbi:hypothetical protein H5392_01290 [Tessaracoccus sp. MC1865]|uniref:hypothetical protein n=1 Tax=Tessaracoccus sp. MC1865 TaxID=2760310 RepID=UPI0015FFC6C9|nr:hypothetical protein [Tessaracoccus sp. MC1865]MBB1482491.1 hypothetical protein [Tessaracoccus sp. MC1865]QTO38054.1 hypothetical protein J7D54_02800 [Tessaracoccus sp. MC1865]